MSGVKRQNVETDKAFWDYRLFVIHPQFLVDIVISKDV